MGAGVRPEEWESAQEMTSKWGGLQGPKLAKSLLYSFISCANLSKYPKLSGLSSPIYKMGDPIPVQLTSYWKMWGWKTSDPLQMDKIVANLLNPLIIPHPPSFYLNIPRHFFLSWPVFLVLFFLLGWIPLPLSYGHVIHGSEQWGSQREDVQRCCQHYGGRWVT